MGNEKWAKAWKEHTHHLYGLVWITNENDRKRIPEIIIELDQIIDRNTTEENKS